MDRRSFLVRSGAASGLLGLAGCVGGLTGGGDGGDGGETTTPSTTASGDGESLPEGVYVQSFQESMAMQGTKRQGDYAVGLMYTGPHEFWLVTGGERNRTPRKGNIHLMAVVWDPETQTVLPEAGVSVEIARDDELVSQEVIYPMLSQRMGFHWGGNFGLDGDGEYVGRVSVAGLGIERTGEFADRFGEPATVEIPLAFTEAERQKIGTSPVAESGKPGAVSPMEMGMMPQATAPAESDLPGQFLAETTSDDAVFLSTALSGDAASRFDADTYLAVSARTPYNRTVLPSMSVEATVTRGGQTVYEDTLTRTLDPDLDYHYGAALDGLESGDEVTLSVTTPPQVGRHEGYERAFLQMDDPMTFTV
jgi:hypothetical protein